MATLLLETERKPATRITGYFESLSDSKFQKNFERGEMRLWQTVYT